MMPSSSKLTEKCPLNSALRKNRCSPNRNCKRMSCRKCAKLRRDYFIKCGLLCGTQWALDSFVTVSWKWSDDSDNSWCIAINNMDKLSKKMNSNRIRPYIRVLAVGKKNCPHVHFSISKSHSQKLAAVVTQIWKKRAVNIQIQPIQDLEGLMGYFFDQNYLVSQLDPNRVKGIRLITASRPMPYGFPNIKSLAQVTHFVDELLKTLPLPLIEFNKHVLRIKRIGGVK